MDFQCRAPATVHLWLPVVNGMRYCRNCGKGYRPVPVGRCRVCGGHVYAFEPGHSPFDEEVMHALCKFTRFR